MLLRLVFFFWKGATVFGSLVVVIISSFSRKRRGEPMDAETGDEKQPQHLLSLSTRPFLSWVFPLRCADWYRRTYLDCCCSCRLASAFRQVHQLISAGPVVVPPWQTSYTSRNKFDLGYTKVLLKIKMGLKIDAMNLSNWNEKNWQGFFVGVIGSFGPLYSCCYNIPMLCALLSGAARPPCRVPLTDRIVFSLYTIASLYSSRCSASPQGTLQPTGGITSIQARSRRSQSQSI